MSSLSKLNNIGRGALLVKLSNYAIPLSFYAPVLRILEGYSIGDINIQQLIRFIDLMPAVGSKEVMTLKVNSPGVFLVYTKDDLVLSSMVEVSGKGYWGFNKNTSLEEVRIHNKRDIITFGYLPKKESDTYGQNIHESIRNGTSY